MHVAGCTCLDGGCIAPPPPASPTVHLVVSLDDLHTVIAESVRIALAATGHRIVNGCGIDDTARKVHELGRNAAAALMLFAEEEEV
jgi:hypothetical protein